MSYISAMMPIIEKSLKDYTESLNTQEKKIANAMYEDFMKWEMVNIYM